MTINQDKYTIVTNLREPDFFHPAYYWTLTVGANKRIFFEEIYPITLREEEVLSIGLSFAHDLI